MTKAATSKSGDEVAMPELEYRSISAGYDRNIEHGDVLLFRAGHSIVSRLICAAGRGRWCHAGVAAWWHGDLFCVEVREWYGGRAVLLEREVARRPGMIDVYRLDRVALDQAVEHFAGELADREISNPQGYIIQRILRKMGRFAGANYGYWSVLRTALYHLPIVRLALRPMTDDQMENGRPPYCSQAVSYAFRVGGGVDLVPNAADCITEPSDLARSALLQYQFTLRP